MREFVSRIRRWFWRRVKHRHTGESYTGFRLLGVSYRKMESTASTTYTYTPSALPIPRCERCGEIHDA